MSQITENRDIRKTNAAYFAFALGFGSIIAQILFIRELTSLGSGGELLVGIVLGIWTCETALGAYLARILLRNRSPYPAIFIASIILCAYPVLGVAAARLAKFEFFEAGEALSLFDVSLTGLFVLAPYCLASGFLFVKYSAILADSNKGAAKAYYLDAAGFVLGGLFSAFIVETYLEFAGKAFIVFLANFFVILIITIKLKKALFAIGALFAAGFGAALIIFDIDKATLEPLFGGREIVEICDTPLGKIVVAQSDGQTDIFLGFERAVSSDYRRGAEEIAFFAAAQRPGAKSALLVGGAAEGAARELRKFNIDKILYIEKNRELVEIARKYISGDGNLNKAEIIIGDGARFVRETKRRFDIIIVDKPPPVDLRTNRFYAKEFFESAKNALAPGGVLSVNLPPTGNYASGEALRLNSQICATLGAVFDSVILIPAQKNYYLASDSALTREILSSLAAAAVEGEYVNPYRFDEFSARFKADELISQFPQNPTINEYFAPTAFLSGVKSELNLFDIDFDSIVAGAIILCLAIFLSLGAKSKGIFAIGYAASTAHVILIFAFQITFGDLYKQLGALFAVFMAGMAAGAYFTEKNFAGKIATKSRLAKLILTAIIYLALLPFAAKFAVLSELPGVFQIASIIAMALAISLITGAAFATAAQSGGDLSNEAAKAFGADLLGAAFGATITAAAIPIIGLQGAALAGAALAAASLIILTIKR